MTTSLPVRTLLFSPIRRTLASRTTPPRHRQHGRCSHKREREQQTSRQGSSSKSKKGTTKTERFSLWIDFYDISGEKGMYMPRTTILVPVPPLVYGTFSSLWFCGVRIVNIRVESRYLYVCMYDVYQYLWYNTVASRS